MTNQLFGLEYGAVRQYTFYPHQVYEQVNFYKKSSLYFIGWSFGNWKLATSSQWAKNWIILTKVWQNLLFYQHSQPLYDVRQKEFENLEFMRGVNFEFIDSFKNNGTKYLLILTICVKRFAIQRPLMTLPRLGDIGVWAQSTLNKTFFTRAS